MQEDEPGMDGGAVQLPAAEGVSAAEAEAATQ